MIINKISEEKTEEEKIINSKYERKLTEVKLA